MEQHRNHEFSSVCQPATTLTLTSKSFKAFAVPEFSSIIFCLDDKKETEFIYC